MIKLTAFQASGGWITSTFDIHYSIFDIRFFRVSFSIKLVTFQASVGADPPSAEHPKPNTHQEENGNP